MAADVFYNFTGETAFASTHAYNPLYENDGDPSDGDIEYYEFDRDNLDGTVYKYRGSDVTVYPSYYNLKYKKFVRYDSDDNYINAWQTCDVPNRYLPYTMGYIYSSGSLDDGSYSSINASNKHIRVNLNVPTDKWSQGNNGSATIAGQSLSISVGVGTYKYKVFLNGNGISGVDYDWILSSGTFYVDQETGIKVISGNPSWVAAGGTVSVYYRIQNQC